MTEQQTSTVADAGGGVRRNAGAPFAVSGQDRAWGLLSPGRGGTGGWPMPICSPGRRVAARRPWPGPSPPACSAGGRTSGRRPGGRGLRRVSGLPPDALGQSPGFSGDRTRGPGHQDRRHPRDEEGAGLPAAGGGAPGDAAEGRPDHAGRGGQQFAEDSGGAAAGQHPAADGERRRRDARHHPLPLPAHCPARPAPARGGRGDRRAPAGPCRGRLPRPGRAGGRLPRAGPAHRRRRLGLYRDLARRSRPNGDAAARRGGRSRRLPFPPACTSARRIAR